MARVVKIIEIMGVSEESFSDAVRQAVKEAARSIRNITGVEVIKSTAQVEGDEIFQYHVTVRLAFAIERGDSVADEGEEEDDEAEQPPEGDEEEEAPPGEGGDEDDEEATPEDDDEGEEEEEAPPEADDEEQAGDGEERGR